MQTSPPEPQKQDVPRGSSSASASSPYFFDPNTGFSHHAWAWLQSALMHTVLIGQLASLEAKEAGSHYGRLAALFGAAALMALFGYCFLVICAVFGLALLVDTPHGWIIILGCAAILHLAAAVLLVIFGKAKLRAGLFSNTVAELRKDQLWPQPNPEPTLKP